MHLDIERFLMIAKEELNRQVDDSNEFKDGMKHILLAIINDAIRNAQHEIQKEGNNILADLGI